MACIGCRFGRGGEVAKMIVGVANHSCQNRVGAVRFSRTCITRRGIVSLVTAAHRLAICFDTGWHEHRVRDCRKGSER